MVDGPRLAQACASLDADVLCLQEIDRGQARSGSIDQVGVVADAMGAAHWRFEPALIGEPGGRWQAATGDEGEGAGPGYGVGLVSRLAVRAWHVVRLAASRVRAPVAVPGGRGRFILLPDEPRVALCAEVEGPGGPLLVATTHLSFVPGYNAVQLRRLARSLQGAAPAGVLLGDLNLPGRLAALAAGWRSLARVKTYPADRPTFQVDHALAWGAVPAVRSFSTRRLPLSDHQALVIDLD